MTTEIDIKPDDVKPHNVDEEAALPTVVDYPVQETVIDLDAETTEADDITDRGNIWDQSVPGDFQKMPPASLPRLLANRVTEVSDAIVFGSANLAADAAPHILIPGHRDRLRVTIQADVDAATPAVYLGHGPDITAGNGWQLLTTDPVTFRTRDVIWCVSGTAEGTTRIQWAIELVAE